MIELGFLSSRNVQSTIYESSLVLHAEMRIELSMQCHVTFYYGTVDMKFGREGEGGLEYLEKRG